VILNGQIRCGGGGAGAWCGVVRARWRRRGHKGHASLKFKKYGSLAKCTSGAPKSIADKTCDNQRKVGRENWKNALCLAPEVSVWE